MSSPNGWTMSKEGRASLRHFLSAAIVFNGVGGGKVDVHTRTLAAFDEWFALDDADRPDRQPATDYLRIDWCVKTLDGLQKGGREKLGDSYPEILMAIDALKRVLQPNTEPNTARQGSEASAEWGTPSPSYKDTSDTENF